MSAGLHMGWVCLSSETGYFLSVNVPLKPLAYKHSEITNCPAGQSWLNCPMPQDPLLWQTVFRPPVSRTKLVWHWHLAFVWITIFSTTPTDITTPCSLFSYCSLSWTMGALVHTCSQFNLMTFGLATLQQWTCLVHGYLEPVQRQGLLNCPHPKQRTLIISISACCPASL